MPTRRSSGLPKPPLRRDRISRTGRRRETLVTLYPSGKEDICPTEFLMRDGTHYVQLDNGAFFNMSKDRRPVKVRKAARRESRRKLESQPVVEDAT